MVLIYGLCGNCDREIQMLVGQSVFDKKLIWHLSYNCPDCGETIELDDTGAIPDEFREEILAKEGNYSIVLEKEKCATVATKILREAMELSLTEAIKLKKKMPGSVFIGTKAETDQLRHFLAAKGLKHSIIRTVN
jgi:DNA-directed RNA polymerase subunit RPC12/RpoP